MKTTIVTTTIYVPEALPGYARNAREFGHTDLDFIVIGDRKTPPETADFCRTVEQYYPCAYLDIPAQQKYLARFPALWDYLPFNSIQRRDVGLLLAYENGADVIITIDDDNFVVSDDFVGSHGIVGCVRELPAYASASGWFNVCAFLEAQDGMQFYHRGYPRQMRWSERSQSLSPTPAARRVAVNAGLWLDDPDIDAVTRLERQPVVCGLDPAFPGDHIALQPGTWSPFNSQNTALMRDAMPAYFVLPYVGRYDDIWAAYVVVRIAEHLGDVISFGRPLVRQARNYHDLWKDLDAERNGMLLTDGYCAALRAIPLRGTTYHDCFAEIVCGLEQTWRPESHWTDSQVQSRSRMLEGQAIWHSVFEALGA